ncbi:ATP-binding cassette domain-containing protein, partial [Geobacillus sp. T6]
MNNVVPIYINSLSKSFGNKLVLNNLNLIVEKPSIISIVGNNGAGKSVFLHCMLNFMKYDSGEIRIL